MKYYKSTTEYNCGIDLHSRQMYVCLMDKEGTKLLHTNIKGNDFDYFLKRIEPYKHDLTIVCESTFNWYWLADACCDAKLEFVLAHALYLKHIHGGKNKNDRIDSEKLAHLLRANLIPPARLSCRISSPASPASPAHEVRLGARITHWTSLNGSACRGRGSRFNQ